ncbi:MAG: hypothetical protein WBE80_00915 [Methylocella sp.]
MSEWKMPAAMRKRVEEQIKNMSVEEAEKFRTQRDELERTLTPKVPEPKDVAEAGREQKMIKSGPEAAEAEVLRFRRLPRPLPVAEPEPLVRGHEEIVLNPGAPKDIANEFVKRECSLAGNPVVLFWSKQFWRWNGRFWVVEDAAVLAGKLSEFLDGAYKKDKAGNLIRFTPTKSVVEGVLYFVEQGLAINSNVVPPMWLESEEPAGDWIVCRNMLVNPWTEETRKFTPDLFARGGVDWDWNVEAECPRWLQFLEEILPRDRQSQDFIEEWGGCNMTSHTAMHTAAMFVGPSGRNGKNTITDVYCDILGEGNHIDCEMTNWIQQGKKSENLLGKRAIIFGDVRLKLGNKWDPGGVDAKSQEMILKIAGGNKVTLGRYYTSDWIGKHPGKITICTNKVLNFNDDNLVKRFVVVHFRECFEGKEDRELGEKLRAELPGIAARFMRAYRRALARGRFLQPASGEVLRAAVQAESNPFVAMARECFVPDPGAVLSKIIAFETFRRWCIDRNRLELMRTTPENQFHKKLIAVPGFERVIDGGRPLVEGRQAYVWAGLRPRLRDE